MVLLSFYGVRMPGSRDRKAVFIVPPAGRDLYELTGWPGAPSFLPGREDRPPREPSGAIECRNIQAIQKGIWGIDPQTPLWCETCNQQHPIIEHRNCRAAKSAME